MSKIIKEIIIMLIICLIAMLLFAILLYDYVPNRKVVAEVTQYTTSQETQNLLADNIDSEENEVVLTYEVTSQDLSSYEVSNEYVPGKANPFEAVSSGTTGEDSDDNTTNTTTNSNTTTNNDENEDISSNDTTENEQEIKSFIDDDDGLK